MRAVIVLVLGLVVLSCVVDLAICVACRRIVGGSLRAGALIGTVALGSLLALIGLILVILSGPHILPLTILAAGAAPTFASRGYARARLH